MARERHSPAYPSPRGESMFPADTRRLASRAAWCRCELRTAPMCCVVLIGLTYCASQCTYVQCTRVHVRGRLSQNTYLHTIAQLSTSGIDVIALRGSPHSGVRCVGLGGAAAPTRTHTHTRRRETGARSSRPCKIRSDHWVSRSLPLSPASEVPEWRG